MFYPGGDPLVKGGAVEEIHVDYKRNSIGVYKWKLDWLVVIFGLSIVFAFGMKGLFKVENSSRAVVLASVRKVLN